MLYNITTGWGGKVRAIGSLTLIVARHPRKHQVAET
jgi:hypothetical protein